MKKIFFTIFVLLSSLISTSAYAGRLVSCQGVSTPEGFKYVGTYCYDYACAYTYTKVFTTFCPYQD